MTQDHTMTQDLNVSPDVIQYLAEYHDEDDIHTAYSGRAMYGRSCIGYVGEDVTMFAFHLAMELAKEGRGTDEPSLFDVEEYLIMIGDPRSDSLGRSTIYYWPNLEYSDGE